MKAGCKIVYEYNRYIVSIRPACAQELALNQQTKHILQSPCSVMHMFNFLGVMARRIVEAIVINFYLKLSVALRRKKRPGEEGERERRLFPHAPT